MSRPPLPAKVNVAAALEGIESFWRPVIAGELNGQQVKLAKGGE